MFDIYMAYIVPLSVFFPLIAALLNYKSLGKPLKIVFYYLIFSGLTNLINLIGMAHHMHTVQIFNVYIIFEFAFLSFMYYYMLEGKWRKTIIPLVAIFSVLCVVDIVILQPGAVMSSYTRSLETVIIIGYSILYLNQQTSINIENNWGSYSLNWINASILMYFASTLFMFVFENYLLYTSRRVVVIVWSIHDTILLLEYVLFGIGFYKCRK